MPRGLRRLATFDFWTTPAFVVFICAMFEVVCGSFLLILSYIADVMGESFSNPLGQQQVAHAVLVGLVVIFACSPWLFALARTKEERVRQGVRPIG